MYWFLPKDFFYAKLEDKAKRREGYQNSESAYYFSAVSPPPTNKKSLTNIVILRGKMVNFGLVPRLSFSAPCPSPDCYALLTISSPLLFLSFLLLFPFRLPFFSFPTLLLTSLGFSAKKASIN